MQLCLRPPVEHARGKPCFGKRYGGAGGPAGIAAPDGRPPDGMAAALPLPSADGPQLSRMLEGLVSGDVAEAFSLNPFFVLLPVLAVGGLLWFFLRTFLKGWHPVRLHGETPFWVALLILFLLFGVVRNTPWYHMYFY